MRYLTVAPITTTLSLSLCHVAPTHSLLKVARTSTMAIPRRQDASASPGGSTRAHRRRCRNRPIHDRDLLPGPQEDEAAASTVNPDTPANEDAADNDAPAVSLLDMAAPVVQGLVAGAKAVSGPCVAVVQAIPDDYGIFAAIDALAPSTLASRFVSDRVGRLLQGDITVMIPFLMMVYNGMATIKNLPWMSFYNRYMIPLLVLLFMGASVLLTLLTDKIFSTAWMAVSLTCLLPLYAILAIRAPNAMLQWSTLIGTTRWAFNWNTFMLRSVLAIVTSTPWIALPVIWIYTFATTWCFVKVIYGRTVTQPKQITYADVSALAAANAINVVHWLGYSNSRWSAMSGIRGSLLPLALLLAHETMSLNGAVSSLQVAMALCRALRNLVSLYTTPIKLIVPVLAHTSTKMVAALPSKETVHRTLMMRVVAMDLAGRAQTLGAKTRQRRRRPNNGAAELMELQPRIQARTD